MRHHAPSPSRPRLRLLSPLAVLLTLAACDAAAEAASPSSSRSGSTGTYDPGQAASISAASSRADAGRSAGSLFKARRITASSPSSPRLGGR